MNVAENDETSSGENAPKPKLRNWPPRYRLQQFTDSTGRPRVAYAHCPQSRV